MIHRLKQAPAEVDAYFKAQFPERGGYSHKFYWYSGNTHEKIYGCVIVADGRHYHNAIQAPLDWFKKETATVSM